MNLDEPGIPAEMPQRLVLASLSLVNFEPLVLLESEPRHCRSTLLLEGDTALLHGKDLKCLESSSHRTDLGRRDCRWITPGSKCSDDTVGISAGPTKAWRLRLRGADRCLSKGSEATADPPSLHTDLHPRPWGLR